MQIKYLLYYLFCIFITNNSFSEEWKGACETNYPPFNYIINGKMVGMDYEIIHLIMKKIGIKFSIENESWNKVISQLRNGEIDFAWQFVQTPARQNMFYLVGPIRYSFHVFMVKNNSNMANWQKLSDFNQKRIGVVKNYNYTLEFDKYKGFSKIEFANNEELVTGLLEGYVDAIIGDYYTLLYISRVHHYSSLIRFLHSSVRKIPRYVAFAKKNKEKSILFNQALNNLINSKEYKNIIEKYSSF